MNRLWAEAVADLVQCLVEGSAIARRLREQWQLRFRGCRREPRDSYTQQPHGLLEREPIQQPARFASDAIAVVGRFGTTGNANDDPKIPATGQFDYNVQADRGGALVGSAGAWNLKPPDGSIVIGDILAVVAQFGHAGCDTAS